MSSKLPMYLLWTATLGVAGVIGWRATSAPAPVAAASQPAPAARASSVLSPISPAPEAVPLDHHKVVLGDRLFGQPLQDVEISRLVAFLRTLTGESPPAR